MSCSRSIAPGDEAATRPRFGAVRISLVLLLCCRPATGYGDERAAQLAALPESLQRAIENRQRISTSVISYRLEIHKDDVIVANYEEERGGVGDAIVAFIGDDDGNISRSEDGKSIPNDAGAVLRTLDQSDQSWSLLYPGAQVDARERVDDEIGLVNPWSIGFSPSMTHSPVEEVVLNPNLKFDEIEFREVEDDGLLHVTARDRYGQREWWIDPAKGWAPVRVRFSEGAQWSESRITVGLVDGQWFPVAFTNYRSAAQNGQLPVQSFELKAGEFNRPTHRRKFTPADIGVEVGMSIDYRDREGVRKRLFWDGTRAVTREEFSDRHARGELQFGPTVQAYYDAAEARRQADPVGALRQLLRATGRNPGERLSEWEQYVEDFIRRYRLDGEQAATARRILTDCQDMAKNMLMRAGTKWSELERRLELLLAGDARLVEVSDLNAWLHDYMRVLGRLNLIFERQLKPRLDKIPTRTQRDAVELDATKKPQPAEKP